MWEALVSAMAAIFFHEDNSVVIRVMETGRNPTMHHRGRTRNVDIMWLYERFQEEWSVLIYRRSERMRADIFTKGYTNVDRWLAAVALINVVVPADWLASPVPATGGPDDELPRPKDDQNGDDMAPCSPDNLINFDISAAGITSQMKNKFQKSLTSGIASLDWPNNPRKHGIESKAFCFGATFGKNGPYVANNG